jgi:ATP-dependent DNA ligase
VVLRDELEGVVAKPLASVYRPGERGWLKVKNRAYWKYELEHEAAISRRTCNRPSTPHHAAPRRVSPTPSPAFQTRT